jgi:D-alanine--poly(phosphoribitol) ligase subunit 1
LIYFINIGLAKKSYFSFFRKIIFGGEGFPKSKLSYLIKKIGMEKKYFNVYGPTECTCICSSYLVKQSDFSDKKNIYVPIGKIANIFNYKILESRNGKAADDKVGELVLSGPNVGYGYINDYQNTKKNFIFHNKKNEFREYKTGDLVKYSKKKDLLYFIGRKDSQIKHMGYRLELNELEIVINRMALVKEACVFYLKKAQSDFGKIIAVISSSKKIKDLDLIKHIKTFLPSYFLPNEIIFCKDLKKNANGKIDRSFIKKFYEKNINY